MADPNSDDVPDNIGPIPTFDEMFMPDGSLRLDFEGLYDHPTGENLMINEEMNQSSHDHPIGENIISNVDRNQVGHDHRIGKNIMLEENVNQFGHGTSQAGTSGVNDQSNAQIPGMFDPVIHDSGNPIQLPEWPVPAKPYACSCCQVLREIIHNIEGESRKFELHGRIGMISHGILEIRRGDMSAPNKEYHFFEESTHRVKMFLEHYCKKQKETGYTLVIDPIWTFYQAVTVGFGWDLGFDINDFFQGSPIHIGEMEQPNVSPPQAQSNEVRSNTRTYKEQRERTKILTIHDFAQYFHLPQNEAAKEVGVSSTVCKKICRNAGLERWPFRQIQSLEKKIEESSKSLNAANPAERARAEDEIQKFREMIAKFYPPYT